MRAFISHSTKDGAFARDVLKPFLAQHEIDAWCCGSDTRTAVDWERQIREALMRSDWILVILSPDAVRSDWVRAETHWALEHRKGRVVPLLLRGCDPSSIHLRLGTLQYIDFRSDLKVAGKELVNLLQGRSFSDAPTALVDDWDQATVVLKPLSAKATFQSLAGPQEGHTFNVDIVHSCILGRGKHVDLRVIDRCASRHHAKLTLSRQNGPKQLLIEDLGSGNGTIVNNKRLDAPRLLEIGDQIILGDTRLRLDRLT